MGLSRCGEKRVLRMDGLDERMDGLGWGETGWVGW